MTESSRAWSGEGRVDRAAASLEVANNPHWPFQKAMDKFFEALRYGDDVGALVLGMSAYVSGAASDRDPKTGLSTFDREWEELNELVPKGGFSATNLVGMSVREFRLRQFRLIIQGAARYYILENGQGSNSPRKLQESLDARRAEYERRARAATRRDREEARNGGDEHQERGGDDPEEEGEDVADLAVVAADEVLLVDADADHDGVDAAPGEAEA